MIRNRFLQLLVFSIIWLFYIFSSSLGEINLTQLTQINWEIINRKLDVHFFVESGCLPVVYLWMFYICYKLLFTHKRKRAS